MQGEALVFVAVIIALVFFARTRAPRYSFNRRRPWKPYVVPRLGKTTKPDTIDAGQQLNAVMAAPFSKQKLLNYSEYRVFKIIESEVATRGGGCRVFAQANLGEILRSPDDEAYRAINSKRVDVLLVNGGGWPILAVEYQGEGHYRGTAAARDAIKKEALRKAGVPYVEVTNRNSDEEILARVREHLGWRPVDPRPEGPSSASTTGAAAFES